jgi:hypothetical protein
MLLVFDDGELGSARTDAWLARWQGKGARALQPLAKACDAELGTYAGTLAAAPPASLYLWRQLRRDPEQVRAAAGDRAARTLVAHDPMRVCYDAQAIGGLGGIDSIDLDQWLDDGNNHRHAVMIAARRSLLSSWIHPQTEVNGTQDYVLTYCNDSVPGAIGAYVRVLAAAGLLGG